MQPLLIETQYLPPVQTLFHAHRLGTLVLEAHETYQKGSYRNRCHLAGANGLQILSIPLERGKNERMRIREVRTSDHTDWQRQHWQTIRSAYGRAPYFEFYADRLEPHFRQPAPLLFAWNETLLRILIECLRLPITVTHSDEFLPFDTDTFHDLRGVVHPKRHRARRPDPTFTPHPYPQLFTERHGFLPNLSALDLLFCLGPEAASVL